MLEIMNLDFSTWNRVTLIHRLALMFSMLVLALCGCDAKEAASSGSSKPALVKKAAESTSNTVSDCAKDLALVQKDLALTQKDLAGTKKDLATAKTRVSAAEIRLAKLAETPAAVYQELAAKLSQPSSVANVDVLITAIQAFKTRFPTAPEGKELRKGLRELGKARKQLKKVEAATKALASIEKIREMLRGVADGKDLPFPAVRKLSNYFADHYMKYDAIAKLPRARFGEAMKDPDSERGKAMKIYGTVIQISKDGPFFKGLICAGRFCKKVYYFFTKGSTSGVVRERKASFAGVLVSRHTYNNVNGGQTHSLLIVGYFKGQQ